MILRKKVSVCGMVWRFKLNDTDNTPTQSFLGVYVHGLFLEGEY